MVYLILYLCWMVGKMVWSMYNPWNIGCITLKFLVTGPSCHLGHSWSPFGFSQVFVIVFVQNLGSNQLQIPMERSMYQASVWWTQFGEIPGCWCCRNPWPLELKKRFPIISNLSKIRYTDYGCIILFISIIIYKMGSGPQPMRWFTTTIYIHLLVGYIYHKPSSDWNHVCQLCVSSNLGSTL